MKQNPINSSFILKAINPCDKNQAKEIVKTLNESDLSSITLKRVDIEKIFNLCLDPKGNEFKHFFRAIIFVYYLKIYQELYITAIKKNNRYLHLCHEKYIKYDLDIAKAIGIDIDPFLKKLSSLNLNEKSSADNSNANNSINISQDQEKILHHNQSSVDTSTTSKKIKSKNKKLNKNGFLPGKKEFLLDNTVNLVALKVYRTMLEQEIITSCFRASSTQKNRLAFVNEMISKLESGNALQVNELLKDPRLGNSRLCHLVTMLNKNDNFLQEFKKGSLSSQRMNAVQLKTYAEFLRYEKNKRLIPSFFSIKANRIKIADCIAEKMINASNENQINILTLKKNYSSDIGNERLKMVVNSLEDNSKSAITNAKKHTIHCW